MSENKCDSATMEDILIEEKEELLLDNPMVLKWLEGDVSFLGDKKTEDAWGKRIVLAKNPRLRFTNQWTNKFGEYIANELYTLLGDKVTAPKQKESFRPDLEINDAIIEVKTSTFFTSGTANEKFLGTPLKYCEIPELYGKPLIILCIGGAERDARYKYKVLGDKERSKTRIEYLNFFRERGVSFMGITELLKKVKR